MYLIRDANTKKYAYHGEGWAFTANIADAKRFANYEDAYKAKVEILSLGERLLDIVPAG
jgi:hypothetical protein